MARILYIEHEPDDMLLVKRLVEAHGHQLYWAPNGQTGLKLAATHTPDLILLEPRLPDVSGYEVVRRLRRDIHHPLFQVPIIALSTNTLPGAELNALAAGCTGFLPKPLDVHALLEHVSAVVA